MERAKAIEALIATSDKEHSTLLDRRAKDDIWWDPDPGWLYMYELEITREDQSMGRTDRSKHSVFFITRELAVQEACNEIRRYLGDRDDRANALWDAEKWQELFDYSQQHFRARRFQIRLTPIRSSVKKEGT